MNISLKETVIGGKTNFLDSEKVRFIRGAITLDVAEVTADVVTGIKSLLAGSFIGKMQSGKFAKYVPGTKGSLTTGVVANNNAIAWTAKQAGVSPWHVELLDPAGNSKPLIVSVGNNKISVSLATSGAGAITSTAAQVIAAVNADIVASQYVTASNSGASTGAAAVVAAASALLDNGTADNVVPTLILADDVVFTQFTNSGGAAHYDQVVTAIDHARVISARLPVAPDDVVKANMPGISWVE